MSTYFSLLLFIVVIITGALWGIEKFRRSKNKEYINSKSFAFEFSREYFPLLAIIFIVRSFIVEPFQIPSGSMMPTLQDGDFIAVNKFNYAIKNPVNGENLIEMNTPKRGDIIVFKFPVDKSTDYIKRVIGLPGDKIIYKNNQLYIHRSCKNSENCEKLEKVEQNLISDSEYIEKAGLRYSTKLDDIGFEINIDSKVPNNESFFCSFAKENICKQKGTKLTEFVVPNDHYFVLGDNRSHSLDGRFWGFVPKDNIVGNAYFIWMSFEYTKSESLPSWLPVGINFNRIGSIN